MYNTKIVCTYNTPEVFLDTDIINKEEEEFIRDAIYRQELLDVLGINYYDEIQIDKAIHDLYEKIKNNKELKECMHKLASNFMKDNDDKFGLIILFSYDYMHLTHICVCELLENDKINEQNMCKLKSLIF